jgi:hypothetical protein
MIWQAAVYSHARPYLSAIVPWSAKYASAFAVTARQLRGTAAGQSIIHAHTHSRALSALQRENFRADVFPS